MSATREFSKRDFLDLLDAALPESAVFRGFRVEYWGDDKKEGNGGGLSNAGRAHAALREYISGLSLVDSVSASVQVDVLTHFVSIEVKGR